jgi:hypothetical protein
MAALPDVTYVNKYIKDGKKAILNLKHFHTTILTSDKSKENIIRIPINDFFLKYQEELYVGVRVYQLSDHYFYKPKMFSLELYQTTELWLGLLRINAMRNISEFCQPLIKAYDPVKIKELINIFFKREGKIT